MLKKNQIIQAKLVEKVESEFWIVSYQGVLVSVKNQSGREFNVGEYLVLQVTGLNPIEFRVIDAANRSDSPGYRRRA